MNEQQFECSKFYLPKNVKWKFAYDDVTFTTSAMIVKDESSNSWAVLFPGSIILNNDTVYISQEAGYPNKCRIFGQLAAGDSAGISLTSSLLKEDFTFWFRLTSNSTPQFDGEDYIESEFPIANGCWCDWK